MPDDNPVGDARKAVLTGWIQLVERSRGSGAHEHGTALEVPRFLTTGVKVTPHCHL